MDIVVRTMTINCARIKQVAFSTAYFQAGQQVLAPKGSSDHRLRQVAARARGSARRRARRPRGAGEGLHGAEFKDKHDGSRGDEDVLTVPNQLDCLVRLQLGQVDAVVTDNALAAGQAAQDPAVELKGASPSPPSTTAWR